MQNEPTGGFPLSHKFYVRTHVKFTGVNNIEAMHERAHSNEKLIKVQLLLSFTYVQLTIHFTAYHTFYLDVNAYQIYATLEINP